MRQSKSPNAKKFNPSIGGMMERAEHWLMKQRWKHLTTNAGINPTDNVPPVRVFYNGAQPIYDGITRGSTAVDEITGDGVSVRVQTIDWLLDVDQIGGQKPKPGDVISVAQVGIPGHLETGTMLGPDAFDHFQVIDVGGRCWTYHGRTRSTYRVHTRLMSESERMLLFVTWPQEAAPKPWQPPAQD